MDFRQRVLAAVRRVGPGRVATYGDVARAAGRPRAWRAVGNIMRECGDPHVPCHRIIAAGGRLGGYGTSPHLKASLLRAEGVQVAGGRVRDWLARRTAAGPTEGGPPGPPPRPGRGRAITSRRARR